MTLYRLRVLRGPNFQEKNVLNVPKNRVFYPKIMLKMMGTKVSETCLQN